MSLATRPPLGTAIIFAVSLVFVVTCLTAAVVGFFPRPAYGLCDAAGAAYRVAELQTELTHLRNENAGLRAVAR